MWQTRERKQRVLSPSHSMVFLISARIVLYRHRKYGHHFGIKASKSIDFVSVLMGKKICIYNGFHSSRLFNSKNLYTIFYCTAHVAEQARRVIQRVFCFLPQSMTRPEMVWPRPSKVPAKKWPPSSSPDVNSTIPAGPQSSLLVAMLFASFTVFPAKSPPHSPWRQRRAARPRWKW